MLIPLIKQSNAILTKKIIFQKIIAVVLYIFFMGWIVYSNQKKHISETKSRPEKWSVSLGK